MDKKPFYTSEQIVDAQIRLSVDPNYSYLKGEISRLYFNSVPNLLFINVGKVPKYVYHHQVEASLEYFRTKLIEHIIANYPELICTEPFLSSEVISPWKDAKANSPQPGRYIVRSKETEYPENIAVYYGSDEWLSAETMKPIKNVTQYMEIQA